MSGSTRPTFNIEGIVFRPLHHDDLPLIFKWLNEPYLIREWLNGRPASLREIEEKYRPRIDGRDPTAPYLIIFEGRPVGYIQSYLWNDYPEHSMYLTPEERNASSLDVFIGEGDFRGRGLGPQILRAFLTKVVFRKYTADTCLITPFADNRIAIRAYEKAGFSAVRSMDHPLEPRPVLLMSIRQGDVDA